MGQTDKAIRRLVDLSQAGIVSTLLKPCEVVVLGLEPTELQVIERVTGKVVRAGVDGVETFINVEFQAKHEAAFPRDCPGLKARRDKTAIPEYQVPPLCPLLLAVPGQKGQNAGT